MSVYWDPAADPILSDDELTYDMGTLERHECDHCGKLARLQEVEAINRSAGFREVLNLCEECHGLR